jgi:hypothetical protein
MTSTARTLTGRRATATAVLAGVLALLAAACAPAPGDPGTPGDGTFGGGTYPIEVAVPAQTVTSTFDLFGLGTCTTTTTTPSFRLPGTATLSAVEIDPDLTSVVVPEASIVLPGATVSAGSLALECFGVPLGSVGLAVDFDGAAEVRSARLDVATRTVTLTDPVVSITNASLTIGDLPPVPIDPFTVTVPTIDVVI